MTMQTSETIGALAEALALAQAEIGGASKSANNPHFRSKYADLSAVWDAWQAVGPAQGLAIVQMPGPVEGGYMRMTTRMMHKSGEWIQETAHIPLAKQDAQGYGSATTYARRYALAAFAGIAPEDDDGEAAVGRGDAKPNNQRQAKQDRAEVAADYAAPEEIEGVRQWATQTAAALGMADNEAIAKMVESAAYLRNVAILERHEPKWAAKLAAKLEERRDYLQATAV